MNSKLPKKKLDRAIREYEAAQKSLLREKSELLQTKIRQKACQEALVILQDLAAQVQEQVHRQVSEIVTRALELVFDDPYEFRIEFQKKRNKTEARLLFLRDKQEIDPLSSAGGGVIDVASFALRLACLSLSRPRVRPLLVLDEPFKFVSEDYLPQVREMLRVLSEESGIQVLMVTHLPELKFGTVFSIPE